MARDPEQPAPAERYGPLGRLKPPSAFFWEAVDPAWRELFQAYVERGMYRRTVLDPKTRELCAVAALTVLGHPGPLRRHILSALDCGASRAEVMEVILQMSVYGGFPATQAALETLKAVYELIDQQAPGRAPA
jgi:alkylhydroperoxidase/carboxymuconolactone decarboxylase family protein YurZ